MHRRVLCGSLRILVCTLVSSSRCAEWQGKGWAIIACSLAGWLAQTADDGGSLHSPQGFRHAFMEGGKMDQLNYMKSTSGDTAKNFPLEYQAAVDFQAQVLLCTITTVHECLAIGQKLRIPTFCVATIPFGVTSELPPIGVASTPFGLGFVNTMAHKMALKMMWSFAGADVNKFRATLGLPEQTEPVLDGCPMFGIYSERVVPRPQDYPAHSHVVGYWMHPDVTDYQPDPKLEAFLAAGPPPVYIGFGSMPVLTPRNAGLITEACKQLQCRAVVCGGWSEMGMYPFPENICYVQSVPHSWLFPRCSVIGMSAWVA